LVYLGFDSGAGSHYFETKTIQVCEIAIYFRVNLLYISKKFISILLTKASSTKNAKIEIDTINKNMFNLLMKFSLKNRMKIFIVFLSVGWKNVREGLRLCV